LKSVLEPLGIYATRLTNTSPHNRKLRGSNSEAGGKLAQKFEKCLKKQLKTYEKGIFGQSHLKTNGS
jgi:hypothetical protein